MTYKAQREFFSKYPFTRELDRTIAAEMNLNPNTIYQYRMGNNRLNYRRAVEIVRIMRLRGIHVHTLDAKTLFDYAAGGEPATVSTGAAPEVVQAVPAPGYAVTLKPSSLRVVLATIEAAELTQAERLELIRHLAAA